MAYNQGSSPRPRLHRVFAHSPSISLFQGPPRCIETKISPVRLHGKFKTHTWVPRNWTKRFKRRHRKFRKCSTQYGSGKNRKLRKENWRKKFHSKVEHIEFKQSKLKKISRLEMIVIWTSGFLVGYELSVTNKLMCVAHFILFHFPFLVGWGGNFNLQVASAKALGLLGSKLKPPKDNSCRLLMVIKNWFMLLHLDINHAI